MTYKNWQIIHCMHSIKQHEATSTDINIYIKYNDIRNIALNIGKEISDNHSRAISTIEKNSESGYYLVKCTSGGYTFHSSRNIVKYVIKADELVCDAVYFNPLDTFKAMLPTYGEEKLRTEYFQVEYCYFNKVKSTINIICCSSR